VQRHFITYIYFELALVNDSRRIVFLDDDTPTPTKVVLHFRRTKWEMLPVVIDPCHTFQIEKIVDTRSSHGITEDLVQWKGWDSFFNSCYLGHTFIRCMEIHRNQFYVTLFSKTSKEVFPDNNLTAFTIHLAQPIDLGSTDLDVGLAELSYETPNRQIKQGTVIDVITSVNVLVYCDLISPQIVGTENVRLLRNIICSTQLGKHMFQNIYYLPIETKTFQDIRIELRETNGEPAAFEASIIPKR